LGLVDAVEHVEHIRPVGGEDLVVILDGSSTDRTAAGTYRRSLFVRDTDWLPDWAMAKRDGSVAAAQAVAAFRKDLRYMVGCSASLVVSGNRSRVAVIRGVVVAVRLA